MVRNRASATTPLAAAVLVMAALISSGHGVEAHSPLGPQKVAELPTSFERALVDLCSPCVTEAYPVAALPVPPVKLPVPTRMTGGPPPRAGEIGFEVLRAYQLGRPERQFLAIRVTLSVAAGSGGEMYRLAVGLLDEAELPVLASTVAHIVQMAGVAPKDPGPASTEIDFQGGSLRVGFIQFRSDGVGYVQAGDPAMLAIRPALEVPTALYLPISQLPALVAAIGRVTAKLKTLRGD